MLFNENFKKYSDEATKEVLAAAPVVSGSGAAAAAGVNGTKPSTNGASA